jgi:hypothetical protein
LDKPHSPFYDEFAMNSGFDFRDYIPRDDLPLCDTMDHSLSLPTIEIQFSKMIARTCDVIDRSVTISPYAPICDPMFIVCLYYAAELCTSCTISEPLGAQRATNAWQSNLTDH